MNTATIRNATFFLMALVLGYIPALGQTATTTAPPAAAEQVSGAANAGDVWFWALLLGVAVALFALSVAVSQYLTTLRNEVPEWVKPYGPTLYKSGEDLRARGTAWLAGKADETPTPLDNELVEVFDKEGRRLLINTASILGYVPDLGNRAPDFVDDTPVGWKIDPGE